MARVEHALGIDSLNSIFSQNSLSVNPSIVFIVKRKDLRTIEKFKVWKQKNATTEAKKTMLNVLSHK